MMTAGATSDYVRIAQLDLALFTGEVLPYVPHSMTRPSANARHGNEMTPHRYALDQNYPNPFNPTTVIRYALAENAHSTLIVYDVLGRQVAKLVDGDQEAGYHEVVLDAASLASGVYFYKLQANSFTQVRKMLLMK
jgi:hypothetical protein